MTKLQLAKLATIMRKLNELTFEVESNDVYVKLSSTWKALDAVNDEVMITDIEFND